MTGRGGMGDPVRATRNFARALDGRSFLMQMGRNDQFCTVEQAQRLYDIIPGSKKELTAPLERPGRGWRNLPRNRFGRKIQRSHIYRLSGRGIAAEESLRGLASGFSRHLLGLTEGAQQVATQDLVNVPLGVAPL